MGCDRCLGYVACYCGNTSSIGPPTLPAIDIYELLTNLENKLKLINDQPWVNNVLKDIKNLKGGL